MHYNVPCKIPPRHESIMPGGEGPKGCSKEMLDKAYKESLSKVGVAGVKRLELAIRQKIDQRTTGGQSHIVTVYIVTYALIDRAHGIEESLQIL